MVFVLLSHDEANNVFLLAPLALLMLFPIQVDAQIVGGGATACEAKPTLEDITTQQLRAVSQDIAVQCLTNKIAVIAFEETEAPFGWTAVDALARSNYTVDEVISSGMGSVGNPTRFFVIMTKD
jgi:hypothetical protein